MSFQDSCVDIRVEVRDGYTVLLAGAGIGDEAYEPAELNLDEGICNSNGKIFNNTLRITTSTNPELLCIRLFQSRRSQFHRHC